MIRRRGSVRRPRSAQAVSILSASAASSGQCPMLALWFDEPQPTPPSRHTQSSPAPELPVCLPRTRLPPQRRQRLCDRPAFPRPLLAGFLFSTESALHCCTAPAPANSRQRASRPDDLRPLCARNHTAALPRRPRHPRQTRLHRVDSTRPFSLHRAAFQAQAHRRPSRSFPPGA